MDANKFSSVNDESGDEIVISGMSGSLPEAYNVREFAKNLYEKKDVITNDNRRWDKTFFYVPKHSGKLINLTGFDTGFFGLHYKQAHCMDIMVRIPLEKAIEAIIDAGINPKDLKGSKTGVFVGTSFSELEVILTKKFYTQKLPVITGTTRSMIANRVSYFLKLNGPSHILDTACSSSLYAMECAYNAIKEGNCDQALVLSVHLCLEPGATLKFDKLGVLNSDGKTKVFDEKANGYTRSESCCALFLQKANTSKRIYAEIIHVKTNFDGFKTEGITFPSAETQSILLREIYDECKVDVEDLTYFEAHGTGTAIGDPIEMSAIDQAIISQRTTPLLIGSVKSNVGHSEPSAGLVAIIKVILAMENELIPPNINFGEPNTNIKPIKEGRAKIVLKPTKLPNQKGLIGVNGFGFGGANAHILLRWNEKKVIDCKDHLPRLVCVSARIQEGMDCTLNDIKKNNLNAEYLGLFHDIYKYDIDGFYYRGFSIVDENGEIQRSSQLLKEKFKTTLWFGDLKGSWQNLLCDMIELPIIEQWVRKIDMLLCKKGINFLKSMLNGERSGKKETDFGEFITKLIIANSLKTINCNFNYYQETGKNQLICKYICGKITLEEAIHYFCQDSENFYGIINKRSISNGFIPKRLLISNLNENLEFGYDCGSNKIFQIGYGFKGIPSASLRDIENRNGLISFLEFLGKTYIMGVTMNLSNLYPLIKFPVSRGTPSISPLLKWNWKMEIPIYKYMSDTTVKIFPIQVKTEQWSYLLGHVIDGRHLFPAIGYLYLVWETIQQSQENITIIFKNCKFIRATYISPDKLTILVVNIKSNKFEVLEDTTVLVIGEIKIEERNEYLNCHENIQLNGFINEESVILNEKDVYKELRLRGYNYSNEFKRIKEYDMIHGRGRITWDGNWVCFIDNMLQMMILEEDNRSLFVPTGIKYLKINQTRHLNVAKDNSEIVVEINRKTNSIRSGGIEIRNVGVSSISKKIENRDPVLEKYEFIPNEGNLSLEGAMRVNIQLIAENWPDNNFKTLELIHNTSVGVQLLSPSINHVLSDLPLLQADLTVVSKFDIPAINGISRILTIPKEGSYTLVITKGLFQNIKILDELVNLIADSGFILTRDSINFDPKEIKSESLEIITVYRVEQETLVLLRKKSNITQQISNVIDVSDTTSFEWIPRLQCLKQNKENIVIYTRNIPENGVLGLVNCLRREPNGKKLQALLIDDNLAPSVELKNSFYLKQLNKGLGINVYKNGKWGTYRHLLLEKDNLVNAKSSFIKIQQWGKLSSLAWVEDNIKNNINDLINIYYLGVNFKDVMLASGRINYNLVNKNRLLHERMLGFEFVGRNAKGERVMGLSPKDGFSTVIPNNLFFMWKIPDDWTMEDAATVTCVYTTVIYALCVRGNVKRGERILIHSGTGAVGLAAINISLHYGLEIFTTVGTQKKRDYLKKHFPSIPDDHIGYSRDLSFQEMINLGTNGQGVDLVLNSLAEEKLWASVRCLAQGGRFLEIGKFDIINDNDLQLELMNLERSYHGVMLDGFCNASDNEKKCLVDLVQDFLDKRIIKPLDRTIFEEDEIEKAIRFMMTGRHIGKVVLKLREEENLRIVPNVDMKIKAVIPRYTSDPEKVSIILGGLGGFGLELTDWLVLRGARKIVLTSRNGIKTGYQKYRIRIWHSYGCEINISTEDITTKYGCEQLITEAQKLGSIQSIFNSALILEDEIFDNQSVEKFKISLAPKAYTTKYLDKITRTRCRNLRDFVVFSSITCGRGNVRQTNYGMANSIMERICEQRKQDGYPGLAIQWGAIGDVGVIAESQEKDELLEFSGTLQQRITSCLNLMDTFLKQSNPVVSSMIVADKRTALFSTQNLMETVGNVLGIKDIKVVSPHSTLSELGMDSMLALEMKQTLENGLQIILTSQEIRDMTFSRLKEIQEQFTMSTKHCTTILKTD